ncbi:inositol 3-kinase [Ranunculus cassubicifolius]
MVRGGETQPDRRGLVVGNYCHDVLIRDNQIIGESLGGAASFVSNVLDGLSIQCDYISRVGFDFGYPVSHLPISNSSSKTTLFHAYFSSVPDRDGNRDRILKRINACDPISPSDIPDERFEFGLAVGVAGEISPETLEKMINLCRIVFVDIQALIRVFDPVDGTVKHVSLKESGFSHLLPKIGFLKASSEEAPFVDVEEVRKMCCVVVTDGKDGCRVYWKDGEMQISPFPTTQVDPTGAGDSFLGALVAGLNWGLTVPDAALLGNFFGSLTVGQIGLPKFQLWLLQRVKDEVLKRKQVGVGQFEVTTLGSEFRKSVDHEDLQASLAVAAKLLSNHHNNSDHNSDDHAVKGHGLHNNCSNGEQKLLANGLSEEPILAVEDQT